MISGLEKEPIEPKGSLLQSSPLTRRRRWNQPCKEEKGNWTVRLDVDADLGPV